MIAADLSPTVARFPCAVEVSIDAPGWETEINAALGVVSSLSGTRFTTGPNGIHFVVMPSLGYNGPSRTLGKWQPASATIALLPANEVGRLKRLTVAQHELLHAAWVDHSDAPDSIMNPQATVHVLSPTDRATVIANGCFDYTKETA